MNLRRVDAKREDMLVAINEFVKRQTPDSSYSHFGVMEESR